MDLLTRMVEHHVRLVGQMVNRAATLSPVQLDEPIVLSVEGVDDDPTLRSLLSRLVGQMGMWNAALAMRAYDWDVERAETISSIQARLSVEGTTFLGHIREVVDHGRLDDTIVAARATRPRSSPTAG